MHRRAGPVADNPRRFRLLHPALRADRSSVPGTLIDDITGGEAAIQQHLNFPAGWQSTVFAAPFGAWGNGEDPWLMSYWDSIFKTVFVQYISAADQALAHAHNVRYRLELGYGAQSAEYLASHLSNAAFTRAGAGSGITTGSPGHANSASG